MTVTEYTPYQLLLLAARYVEEDASLAFSDLKRIATWEKSKQSAKLAEPCSSDDSEEDSLPSDDDYTVSLKLFMLNNQ
jgi:hypothetical protein